MADAADIAAEIAAPDRRPLRPLQGREEPVSRPRPLTPAQRRGLAALDARVLRQWPDLAARGMTYPTLNSLLRGTPTRPALARRVDLKPPCWLKTPYHTFYCLSDAGAAIAGASS